MQNCLKQVLCFEANPGLAGDLRRLLQGTNSHVEAVGLSDADGILELKVPFVKGKELHGWASIDGDFGGRTWKGRGILGTRDITVPVKRLDSFDLAPVGFVKIDVEGHELNVLRGAVDLLQRDQPNLLVEIEQRHHEEPISTIFNWLQVNHGYRGWFLDGPQLRSISDFSVDIHQRDPDSREYRNNFYFTAGKGACEP